MAANTALAAYRAGEKARRRGHRRRAKFTIPLAVVAGIAPLAIDAYGWYRAGSPTGQGIQQAMGNLIQNLTGYDNNLKQWQFAHLMRGWSPIIAGVIVHKVANRMGINRSIRRFIPWLSI